MRQKVCRRGHDQTQYGYTRKDTGQNMCLACGVHCRTVKREQYNAKSAEWKRNYRKSRAKEQPA